MANDPPNEAIVNVVDRYGARVAIPLSELGRAQERGYRLESGAGVVEGQREQKYDQPLQAGIEGLARGLTFGISDLGGDEGVAERKRYNPWAAGLGEVGGSVAGLGMTGLGGLAERAGAAAFGAPGILSRAGAAAVRGGLEGTALGTGQAVSQLALSDDPLTAESVASALGHHIGIGAATGGILGGGLSLAGSGMGAVASKAGDSVKKLAGKFSDELAASAPPVRAGFEDVAAMTPEVAEAGAGVERAALQATKATEGHALAQDVSQFYQDSSADILRLKNTLPKGTELWEDVNAAQSRLKNAVRDVKTLGEDPTRALGPLRELQQQIEYVKNRLPEGMTESVEGQAQRASSITDAIDGFESRIKAHAAEPTSPRLEALEERAAWKPGATPILDAAAKGIGGAVGGAIGHAIPVPGAGIAGAWLGKEIGEATKPLLRSILGNFAGATGAVEEGAQKLLTKLTPPPSALNALSDLATAGGVNGADTYSSATQAIQQAVSDPSALRTTLMSQLAGVNALSPKLAEQVADNYQLKLNFLASKIPQPLSMGINGKEVPPSDAEKSKFARYVAAANDPMRLLRELRAGTLTPETVEATQAVSPAWTQKIKDAVTEQLSDPAVASKLSYPMRLQLGTFLGKPVDATMDPAFIANMQSTFSTPPQPMPPPKLKTPTNAQSAVSEPPTGAQRLAAK